MVKRAIGGVERDYLLIVYKGGDKLYVPSDQIDTLRQYVGGEAPTLHRLGGSDFAKAKSRVRSAVRAIAQELVVLYQKRVHSVGHSFGPDTPWQHEMEEAFPYVETPDQRVAIDDVKSDMERAYPMDRLVCGDVGFGKTEVAIRAAFKAIQEGKQVAVLAPTTLLANQHGNTFADRFAGYPIRVEVLSRFLTNAQAKTVIDGLRTGEVDCVIGTHRLLTNDVTFKDLGLLVVDEEQRFGVQHKEAMKKLKVNVDIITLTATPIPRTLEMSLVGIRDLSLLQTPPADRQPILTYVGEYDERVAIEAIRRELLREGQVFWVHNRVRSIETAAARLRQLVPEARIAVAHGQIDEGTLEQVVVDFSEGRYDVLVCTTIIESGIDMPTVNTLVVERSDLLGLGQMHQLRGRVGRSGQRAYAYLFHPRDRPLTEDAYERLRTIGESTELGSGFKIAMRDLEIRGAGNLLGEAQSGHIAAVGYDLYCQMVTEAVAEMKGEPIAPPSEIKLDVPTDAFLPADYVTKEELRLEAYRRLAAVTSESEVADIRTEWEDRYGPLPQPAEALLMVGSLRAECNRLGITDMQITVSQARLSPIELKLSESMRLKRLARDAILKEDQRQLVIPIGRGKDPATFLVGFLRELIPDADR
jgi:transcription-repair coupling factor (superfamily II helicase)